MFLIRVAFWLSVAILFIPAGERNPDDAAPRTVSAGEAVFALHALWTDLSGFCARNPQVCETRDAALVTFTDKARNGARIVYQYLGDNEQRLDADQAPAVPPSQEATYGEDDSVTTLYPSDT